jgi:hypothetical protein
MRNQDSHRLIKHGIAAMIVALLAGFGLIFAMIGGVSLSPLPVFFQWEIPGTLQGWRSLHIGMLMNGLMAILLGVVMRFFAVSSLGAAVVSWGTILAVWGNFSFYFFGMFAPNRGVTLQANRLGEATLSVALAFYPAFVGIITLTVALIVLLLAKPNAVSQSNAGSAR